MQEHLGLDENVQGMAGCLLRIIALSTFLGQYGAMVSQAQDPIVRTGDVYAIGDVHGRADLLQALLRRIRDESNHATVVFLGDLIDRGPDTCAVLDIVASHIESNPHSELILGNHDWFLREFLLGRLSDEDRTSWIERYGGGGALGSYGLNAAGENWAQLRQCLLERWPAHAALLERARHSIVLDDICFVHAGLRPGIPLAEQSAKDLMWIKGEFLDHLGIFEHLVVHGHSPTKSGLPEIYPNRIALDTRAFASDRLSCAAFANGTLSHFLCTDRNAHHRIAVRRIEPGDLA